MPKTIIVIPCYNEEKRLDSEGFRRLLASPEIELLFVNDGSNDRTPQVLTALCELLGARTSHVNLPVNVGKAEAVRLGLLRSLANGADITGYCDADLATPPEEIIRLVQTLIDRQATVTIAARVGLLGTRIERSPVRHYLGRVFATIASNILRIRVYDTQCGAKVFRVVPAFRGAVALPFRTRWVFDVELLGRLLRGMGSSHGVPLEAFVEMPLQEWSDVEGSKMRISDLPGILLDLWRVYRALAAPERFPHLEADDRAWPPTPVLAPNSEFRPPTSQPDC